MTVLNQGTNKEMNMNIVFSVTYWHKADFYDKKESQNQLHLLVQTLELNKFYFS